MAIEHYRALPDRLLGQLLEARLLAPLHPSNSRQVLDRLLAQASDSPWPHLAMLEWAANRRSGDPVLAEKEFETFRQMCPDDRFIFRYLYTVRDPEKLRRHVEALRSAIESGKKRGLDAEDLDRLRTAWTFERAIYGRDRLEEFRKLVRSDVDYLRRHPMWEFSSWSYLVRFGYEDILGENTAAESLDTEILEHAPKSYDAYYIRKSQWRRDNPPPSPPRSPEPGQPFPEQQDQTAYYARQLESSLALIKDFWGQGFAGMDAGDLLSHDGVPAGTVGPLADFALSSAERFPDQFAWGSPVEFLVAQAYVDRRIRLEQVPGLVDRGLKEIEDQQRFRADSDTLDERRSHAFDGAIAENKWRAQEIRIGHAIATGQMDQARTLLAELRRQLDQARSAPDASDPIARWRREEFTYRELARKAGIEVPLDAQLIAETLRQEQRYSVAPFEAKDLSGRTWTDASLRGKVTYVSVWTTGCGRTCRAGLQGVQQLFERWKSRADRAVLTISVDANIAITESFMKENGYAFPMIHGPEVAQKLVQSTGWPRSFLIDPQGRRVRLPGPGWPSPETLPVIEEMANKVAAAQ